MGARNVALLTHHEFQLSRGTHLRRQETLLQLCVELATRIAMWKVPEKLDKEFQKTSSEMGTHEIERDFFTVYL